jgi:hypothetical protein
MELVNDPLLWILSAVALVIVFGPWLYKKLTGIFGRDDRGCCVKKIDCLIKIRSSIKNQDAKKALSDVILVLIEEHDSHE